MGLIFLAAFLAFVVTEPCHGCKYTDCVAVCPCDCFHEGEHMLYIDPADCIDCEACVPECPVEAIFHETNVPGPWAAFAQLNAERVADLKEKGGRLTERQEPKEGPGCRDQARNRPQSRLRHHLQAASHVVRTS